MCNWWEIGDVIGVLREDVRFCVKRRWADLPCSNWILVSSHQQGRYRLNVVSTARQNESLLHQAASNRKKQFANSPDLKDTMLNAIM